MDSQADWQIDILDEPGTGDGGWVTGVQMTHITTRLCVCGQVVQYEGETPFTDSLGRNDLFISTALARRLIAKVGEWYAPVDEDCGLTACVLLEDFIADHFEVGAKEMQALIANCVRLVAQ